MTQTWPLRFRGSSNDLIFTDEAGGWFAADGAFLGRYARNQLTVHDVAFLKSNGHAFEVDGDLAHSAYLRRWADRHASPAGKIGYVILVPTLRCNLACDYCQVSRAPEAAPGFDWTDDTLDLTLQFLGGLETDELKVEFQGGEPLLRLDLLERVRDFCRERFARTTFVVCSNFQRVDDRVWQFFADDDTFLSTSIDGDAATHSRQRTHSVTLTDAFLENVGAFVARFGNNRISALPTVDIAAPPDPEALIDAYASLGLRSIYLRPVNRQGFARRTPERTNDARDWALYHRRFVEALMDRNVAGEACFEEFYLTHALRRVMRAGTDHHVDLRNPNLIGDGYIVVDYDGGLYPSDEARMMSRVGQIDLGIGHVATGIEAGKIRSLNAWSFNDLDPDCQHCAFQPYCGTDIIDDISRYGRIDVPKADTWFCQRHTALFDLVFELLRSDDEKVIHSMKRWAGVETWPRYLSEVHS